MKNSDAKVWFLGMEDKETGVQLLGLNDFEGEDSIGHFIPVFSSYERALAASHTLGLNNEEMADVYPSIYCGKLTEVQRCDEL